MNPTSKQRRCGPDASFLAQCRLRKAFTLVELLQNIRDYVCTNCFAQYGNSYFPGPQEV